MRRVNPVKRVKKAQKASQALAFILLAAHLDFLLKDFS
jgi:hypothetical protein